MKEARRRTVAEGRSARSINGLELCILGTFQFASSIPHPRRGISRDTLSIAGVGHARRAGAVVWLEVGLREDL